ncbi:hypothetical protein DET65_0491 [Sunxiuqinia elliptica]|uniref:Uncharacterized protein n=2 Tax=Sunxiuqinia elliptica TaxID=655355 RepID=A0A4R6GL21_9BACT|nr:hypothetical protein DET52_11433 [Sunxiuqinia elliptica]TDO66908.1 hypothetical protein DET65_0491 [Sunxiuqinia elliptica]
MENMELKERIGNLTDEALIDLLRQRNSYEPIAVEFAIEEAIKRGVLQSKADLDLAQFAVSEKSAKSIFPHLTTALQFSKVFSSLTRMLCLIAVVPLVLGLLELTENNSNGAAFLLLTGGSWLTLSVLLARQKKAVFAYALIGVLVAALGYMALQKMAFSYLQLADWVVIAVGILLIAYVLLYLAVLVNRYQAKK